MRLELQHSQVNAVRIGWPTAYEGGVLTIDTEELTGLLLDDRRIESVALDVVAPDTPVRITNVLDVLEPRVKIETGSYFPGLLADVSRAGNGITKVLRGAAVLEMSASPGLLGSLIDMTGPGAALTNLSKTHNICILVRPKAGLQPVECAQAAKRAAMAAAVYLASAATQAAPDDTEVFDLDLAARASASAGALPRVAYLLHVNSVGDLREPFLYGFSSGRYHPTVLHPNEVLDGAVVCGAYNLSSGFKNLTFVHLNNPVIRGLYARHGIDLDFRGVVVANEPVAIVDMKRTAMMACGLLKDVLGAEGVVMTKEAGGHTDVVLMESCEACEQAGIRTVILDNEWLGPDGTGTSPLLSASERADAMVSVGNIEASIDLPGFETIVGGDMEDLAGDVRGPLKAPIWLITNALSQIGSSHLTTERR
jgi:sarcosine reductase